MTHPLTAAVLCAAAVSMLGACSSAVEVAPLPQSTSAVCRGLAWPQSVGGHAVVTTAPEGPAQRAWGDPPVIARCGGAALPPTTTPCLDIDGQGWIAEELSDGVRFTTFGTEPSLEVLVPRAYAPEPLLLPAFTTVARALPRNGLECR